MVRNPRRHAARTTILLFCAVGVAALFLLPVLWALVSAVRPAAEIFRFLSPLTAQTFVPTIITLESFQALFAGRFATALVNSVAASITTVGLGLALCSMAAFALSSLTFRHRDTIFALVVISFMVPFEVVAIPLATAFRTVGLQNTFAGLILPGLANGLVIFLLRQFFLGIPVELRDAARVDGASWRVVFLRIYLPLSRPVLVAAGVILFLSMWRQYLWPLLVISDPTMDLAPVALGKLIGQYQFDFGQLFAGAMLLAAVPTVLLLRFQREFVQSGMSAGIKG